MNDKFLELPLHMQIVFWVVITTILLCQSIFIFLSARKREKNAWFWGFIGLLNFPTGMILYYFCVVYPDKKKERK